MHSNLCPSQAGATRGQDKRQGLARGDPPERGLQAFRPCPFSNDLSLTTSTPGGGVLDKGPQNSCSPRSSERDLIWKWGCGIYNQVDMKSYWMRWGFGRCPSKKMEIWARRHRDAGKEAMWPWRQRREGRHLQAKNAESWQGTDSPSGPPEGTTPVYTVTVDFRPPSLRCSVVAARGNPCR